MRCEETAWTTGRKPVDTWKARNQGGSEGQRENRKPLGNLEGTGKPGNLLKNKQSLGKQVVTTQPRNQWETKKAWGKSTKSHWNDWKILGSKGWKTIWKTHEICVNSEGHWETSKEVGG